jgi:hypothetical protein
VEGVVVVVVPNVVDCTEVCEATFGKGTDFGLLLLLLEADGEIEFEEALLLVGRGCGLLEGRGEVTVALVEDEEVIVVVDVVFARLGGNAVLLFESLVVVFAAVVGVVAWPVPAVVVTALL